MKWRVPDSLMFTVYALPLFCFPLSTAGAGISAGLLLVIYAFSGHWRKWRLIQARPWALPLALLIGWTLLGLLWTTNMFFGFKVAEATSYGIFAFIGATLPWKERWIKWLITLFLAGLLINAFLAALMTWDVLPWKNVDDVPYTGFCDHIFLSLAIAHALLWLTWDFKRQWNFPRWANLLISIVLLTQMAVTPARSGQLLLVLLLPIAVWMLYLGRWRYWASTVITISVAALFALPTVRAHFMVGIHELLSFNIHRADITSSWGIRILAMIGGVMLFLAHPLFGVGTGNFYPAILKMQAAHQIPATPGFIMNTAANSFVSEAASLGIIGLGLFLWFLWSLGHEMWKLRILPQNWFALSYLSIYLIGGLFDGLSWGYADAITIALMAGLPLYQISQVKPELTEKRTKHEDALL